MSLARAIEIARGLTHSSFTQAKAEELLAELEAPRRVGMSPELGMGYEANPLHDNTVAPDEIDEDPPELFAIDADDPDGGNNRIPVDDLAGCAVEIRALPPILYNNSGYLA